MTVRDTHSPETSHMWTSLSFEGQSWFITQKVVGSELASRLGNRRGWGLQATTAAGGHSANGICLVATASQLDREWRPGLREFLWSPSYSHRTSAGCFTEAVVTELSQISGLITAGQKRRGESFWSQIFLTQFSGLLNYKLWKTEIFLTRGFRLSSQKVHYFQRKAWIYIREIMSFLVKEVTFWIQLPVDKFKLSIFFFSFLQEVRHPMDTGTFRFPHLFFGLPTPK